jgi:hypothetical protein
MAELNVAPAADSDNFASMADSPAPPASDSPSTSTSEPAPAPAPSARSSKVSKWHRITTPAAVGRAAE